MPEPIVREHPQRAIRRLERQVEKMKEEALARPLERIDSEAVAAINQMRDVLACLASEVIALRIENEGMRRVAAMPAAGQPVSDDKPDLCHGIGEIAKHLGLSARQAQHLNDKGELPTFKLGRNVCALRSKLDGWLQQSAGRAG